MEASMWQEMTIQSEVHETPWDKLKSIVTSFLEMPNCDEVALKPEKVMTRSLTNYFTSSHCSKV
jgi:hypothetical protein